MDVCLPPSLDTDACIRALKAGKQVLCEKPISLRIAGADRMVETAKRTKRQLMIGQVLPFFPEYDFYNLAENPHAATPLTLLSPEGSVEQPELRSTDPLGAFVAELQEAALTVECGEPSLLLNGVLARDALLICCRQSESVRTGQVVNI